MALALDCWIGLFQPSLSSFNLFMSCIFTQIQTWITFKSHLFSNGDQKTSPSHLSISKFQPQQSFYTKNYLKHNKPSQIKQRKQQTNISPQNIVDFGGSPGRIWVFSFSRQISPHFGVPHLGLAAAMTTSGSSATSAFKRSFSPLIPGKVMGEGYGERFGKKMSFCETKKGGCTEKTSKIDQRYRNILAWNRNWNGFKYGHFGYLC